MQFLTENIELHPGTATKNNGVWEMQNLKTVLSKSKNQHQDYWGGSHNQGYIFNKNRNSTKWIFWLTETFVLPLILATWQPPNILVLCYCHINISVPAIYPLQQPQWLYGKINHNLQKFLRVTFHDKYLSNKAFNDELHNNILKDKN